MLDIGAVPEVLKGIGTMLAAIITFVLVPVGTALWDAWKKRRKAAADADHPTIAPANPFGHAPPPTDPLLRMRVETVEMGVTLAKAEWQMDELRREMADLRRDMAAVADDARRTAAALTAAQTRLDAATARIATLESALEREHALRAQAERERDAADTRARAAAAELSRLKAEMGSTHSTSPSTAITPLRPGRR